jgi:2-(3-amino-3-carboxypropyl)histidine synthase
MVKTLFVPARGQANIQEVVNSILAGVLIKKIGLVTTAQFVSQLPKIKERLEQNGKEVIISAGRPNPGQVLGCDCRAAKGAECYAYIGTGRFHPQNVARKTGRPTYIIHPMGGLEKISEEEVMRYEKIRAAKLHRYKEAKTIGVLVSTKPGQNRFEAALKLKNDLKGKKETFIFVANEIKPDYFVGYNVNAWVNSACLRIAEDDFDKPVVDISEI